MSSSKSIPSKAPLLPEEITARFLRSMRDFYPKTGNLFFQENNLLLQAIAYPARWLDDRGVAISAARYTKMLTEIIRIIKAHGNLTAMRSPARYLLHAVQEHMKHHGEDYYEIGKATRNAFEDAINGLKSRAKSAEKTADSTVSTLAQTHRVLAAAKKPKRKAAVTALQGDLF